MVSSWACVAALLLCQEEKPAAQVEQKHDVGAVLAVDAANSFDFDLAPLRSSASAAARTSGRSAMIAADLTLLLENLLEQRGGTEKFEINVPQDDEPTQLVVVGSPAIQKHVDRLIGQIATPLRGETELEIRVLALTGDGTLPAGSVTIDTADAERLEAELVAAQRARVARVGKAREVDGVVTTITSGERRRLVHEYSITIGDPPIHYDPVVDEPLEGLTATLRSTRLNGATRLELALRCSETVEPARSLVVEPTLWYPEPRSDSLDAARAAGRVDVGARMFHGKAAIHLDLPVHRFASLAGSFLLQDGKALWIPCRVATKAGVASWVVVVRRRGPVPNLVTTLDRQAGERPLALVDVAALDPWSFDWPAYSRASFDDPGYGHFAAGDGSETAGDRWPAVVMAQWRGRLADENASGVEELLGADSKLVAELYGRQWRLVEPAESDAKLEQRLAAVLAPPAAFEIDGRILRAGVPVAEFRLPVVAGVSATLWSGFDGTYLRTWSVDVANLQQVGVPLVSSYLDGFALTFVASPIAGGRVQVTVRGVVNLVEQPPSRAELGPPDTPFCELTKSRRLFVDDETTIVGGRSDRAIPIGGSSLALEVTAVAR